jgi:hypothetical protein
VVESQQQKQQVIAAIAKLTGVHRLKIYVCVIVPFNPLSKWLKQSPKFNIDRDVLVTISHISHENDQYGHVVFHDTLERAKMFLKSNSLTHQPDSNNCV